VASSERAIKWNLRPAPKLICANALNAQGIDFREFAIEGDGFFDYDCSVLQVVAIGDNSLKVRSSAHSEFENPRPKGSARVCLPGERVKGEWRGTGDFLGVYLTPFTIERIFERPFQVTDFRSGEQTSQIVSFLLGAIRADVVQGSPDGPAFAQSVIVSLLHFLNGPTGGLLPRLVRRGLSKRQLKKLQEMIDAEFASPLTLEQLSREAGLSPGYLSRAFKISTGITPHQYILRIRVDRATRLIQASSCSLDEIAERVGFADGSHMTSVFLKVAGKPPSHFRNR
jgi:AraC family transcriptional regulator